MGKPTTKPAPKNSPRGGTQRKVTTVITRQDDPEEPEELEPQEEFIDETEEVLESVFAEARGHSGVEIRVYKLDPDNRSGARAYAMSVSLEDAEGGRLLDTLQRKWKGGEFELMARAEGRIVKRAVIAVLPPPEEPAAPAAQVQEQMSNVLKVAMEPMQQILAELRNKPQFKFEDLLTKGAMLLPLLSQVRSILQPLGGAAPVANDPMAILVQMKTMKDTMEAMGMGDREPDGFDRILTLFNNFKPMLEKMQAAQLSKTRVPARPAAPVTAGSAMPIPSVNAPAPVTAAIPEILLPFIPLLSAAARGGETTESVAERILNALPDEAIDPLADALEDGSLVSALLQKPEFNGLAPWLNALAQNILSALSSGEELEEETPEDVSGTNGADATGEANLDS
jgi:hypothetical protein